MRKLELFAALTISFGLLTGCASSRHEPNPLERNAQEYGRAKGEVAAATAQAAEIRKQLSRKDLSAQERDSLYAQLRDAEARKAQATQDARNLNSEAQDLKRISKRFDPTQMLPNKLPFPHR